MEVNTKLTLWLAAKLRIQLSLCRPSYYESAMNLEPTLTLLKKLHKSSDLKMRRSEERRVGKECRSLCDWSSDVCSSDLTAVALSSKLLRVCNELRANINTVEKTAQKLRSENEINARKLKALSQEKLTGIQPVTSGSVTLLKGIFENLSDDQLQEFAGEIIINPNTLVLL